MKIEISDIRKACLRPDYMLDGLDLIIDKLEELEERMNDIQREIYLDKLPDSEKYMP